VDPAVEDDALAPAPAGADALDVNKQDDVDDKDADVLPAVPGPSTTEPPPAALPPPDDTEVNPILNATTVGAGTGCAVAGALPAASALGFTAASAMCLWIALNSNPCLVLYFAIFAALASVSAAALAPIGTLGALVGTGIGAAVDEEEGVFIPSLLGAAALGLPVMGASMAAFAAAFFMLPDNGVGILPGVSEDARLPLVTTTALAGGVLALAAGPLTVAGAVVGRSMVTSKAPSEERGEASGATSSSSTTRRPRHQRPRYSRWHMAY